MDDFLRNNAIQWLYLILKKVSFGSNGAKKIKY